jgi:two-component system CheB/CheR fusion protein
MAKKRGQTGRTRKSPRPAPADPVRPTSPSDSAEEERPESQPDGVADVVIAEEGPGPGFPVVGIGASAGGLEAFSTLLRALPSEPGLAFVVVQHLAPHHESALPSLLSGQTALPVIQAEEGMPVERNHVYVIPPNVQMAIQGGRLHLAPRPNDRTQYTPIDVFLRSLADDAHDHAIAVVLSGTASDGTAGVHDIKGMGGITIAQRPETAKYDGMPRAAIASGAIDLVLSPAEIAAELARIARHANGNRSPAPRAARAHVIDPHDALPREDELERIFWLLHTATGVDFKHYKLPTIQRRIQRRMLLQKLTSVDRYVAYLEEQKGEVLALYQDILINVTRFFRESGSFEALGEHVFPGIMQRRGIDQPIRIWVPGCATGEEAYSVAIVLLEFLGEQADSVPIQIFATDLSNPSIERARDGLYPEAISADVTPARLRRFFNKSDGGFRVAKPVRDLCVFARQDLTRDPPFSKLDLLVCRNVLIYLGTELQKRLMNVFHYALRPTGYLMLGHAETIGPNSNLYATIDKKYRIYQRKTATSLGMIFPVENMASLTVGRRPPPAAGDGARSVQSEATRIIQERYAPPSVIVDADYQVVQFRGHTGAFLEHAPGDPTLNVLKLAREGLVHGLRSALHEASRSERAVRKAGLRARQNGSWHKLDVEVVPMLGAENKHYLVLFHQVASNAPAREAGEGAEPKGRRRRDKPREGDIIRLQEELAGSREYLQSIIQDLEAANEELQSANEEILSSNEELQSTNEELDTAKEELQSTNEELNTVNDELNARNEELSRLNSDLVNLLASVQIAIVIVANDLRIRRFTPMAERLLNLIPSDIGRPISHIKPNVDCPDLEEFIAAVIDTVTPNEREVRDRQGNWLSLRVRPYKNVDSRIDGAVLTLFEIDGAGASPDKRPRPRDTTDTALRTVRQPVLVLDDQKRVKLANGAFYEQFGLTVPDVSDRIVYELGEGDWDIPRLRGLLEHDLASHHGIDGVEIVHDFAKVGRKRLVVNARRLDDGGDGNGRIVLSIESGGASTAGDRR